LGKVLSFINNRSTLHHRGFVVAQNELARSIFRGLSPSYDSVVDWMTLHQDRTWKLRMLRRLAMGDAARILDIGCGTGVLEEMDLFGCSEVVGIDITSGMLRLAQKKDLRSVCMLGLADAEHLPFADESFDLVVSCYVPKYCDTRTFVEELARVLKPGGRVALYDSTMPRGLVAPLLKLYVFGFMPVFGKLVEPLDASLAFTCGALPGLIRSTTWDVEIEGALAKNGLSEGSRETMTGGVVTVFWASKD
jgi:demethylmenaquinone methyltransferase / 2-methoxy-6-polyprenyl-1,4-benzoquinol methylase